MDTNAAASGRQVIIRVLLDEQLHDALEFQALTTGTDIESLIAQRLQDTLDYSSEHPIYLDDEAVPKLRGLLGNSVTSPQTLLAKIRMLVTARVIASVGKNELPPIQITAPQIEQIGSYARTLGKPFDETFVMLMREAIAARLQA